MRNVIVVIGSVTSKQYEPLRFPYLRRGMKTKIVRIEDDILGLEVEPYINSEAEIEVALHDFCDAHDIGLLEVCEVVVLPQDIWEDYDDGVYHAFSTYHADFWPRLKRVTVVFDDDGATYYEHT